MRVLILCQGFYKASGGVESHVFDLVTGLPHYFGIMTDLFPSDIAYREQEFSRGITLISVGPTNNSVSTRPSPETMVWGFPLRLARDYVRLWRKARKVSESDWDVYHFHGHNVGTAILRLSRLVSGTGNVPSWLLDAPPRSKRLLTIHGLSSTLTDEPWIRELEWLVLSHFDTVICVDKHLVSELRRIAGQQSLDIRTLYIPNWVDTQEFPYSPFAERDAFRVGFVGRAEMSRGIGRLESLAKILPKPIELHLVFAGNRVDLSRIPHSVLARATSVRTNLSRSEMIKFFKSIDVLFNPVVPKGISRTTLESMAIGRPVLMFSTGDRYPLIHEETGYLVDSAEDAAGILAKLVRNRDPLYVISKQARERVEREFDGKVILPRLDDVYGDIGQAGRR